MLYNVFNTEQDAIDAQEESFTMFMAMHSDNPNYTSTTTAWDDVRRRNDGKWVFQLCPACDPDKHTTEEYQESWFN